MIKKMLVALDGSENADRALNYAFDLAEKCSAEVLLLSVVPPIPIPTDVYVSSEEESTVQELYVSQETMELYSKGLTEQIRKMLSKVRNKAKKARPDLKISTKSVKGRPADKIVETATENGFDLIVLGSRGLSGVKELVLGSVSAEVADKATCPVIIVK